MTQPDTAQERLAESDLRTFARIWPHARPDAWAMGLALLTTPVVAALNLAQPLLLKTAIDEHIVVGQAAGLREVALLYLGAVVASYLVAAAYGLLLSWSGQRTIVRLRLALYAHLLGLNQSFFDRQPAGKLLTRVTSDVESLGESLTAGTVTILLDVLMIVGVLGAMFLLDWRLSLALLALGSPLLALLEMLRRRLKRLYLVVREALASVNAFLAERVDGVEVVQLMGIESREAHRFNGRNERFRDATKEANWYDAGMFAVVDGVSRIFAAVVLWMGAGVAAAQLNALGFELTFEPVSAGLMVAFIDYLERLFRPLREVSGKITILQRSIAALSKIFWLFEVGETVDPGTVPVSDIRGHLVMRDVRFAYSEDGPDVLRGVDLEVRPGESVAVVGASGSGKTTLTRLIDRSYGGYRGSITLDGVEVSSIQLADLRGLVAAVRQDIQIFSESISFNVGLDNPAIDDARRVAAAELVHAERFIERLGWEHVLRERGADLSVGEGQLLTFARTMAHSPALIILDEATASIDSMTENLVQAAISRILERTTVIVIAHRLSTIRSADRIVVLGDGCVLEQGTHETLMEEGGAYAALVHAADGVMTSVADAS